MNTACIVVLATADGARGIVAHLANRSDNEPLPTGNARAATDGPIGVDGVGLMATASLARTRVPSLIHIQK